MFVDANGKIFFRIGNNKIPLTGEVFQEMIGDSPFSLQS